MSKQITICRKCVHFLGKDATSPRKDVWYNHFCKASPLPTRIDPYDGKEKPCGVNDLGGAYFTENKFQYCRDVNDGACTKWKALSDKFEFVSNRWD